VPLEQWVKQHVRPGDLLVLEASGNSVETVERIERAGGHALILESQKAGQIGKTYCKTDKVDAIKLARIYLSGLATVVWKPDATTRARREIFQRHRKSVQDTTRARNRLKSWFNEHNYRPAPGAAPDLHERAVNHPPDPLLDDDPNRAADPNV